MLHADDRAIAVSMTTIGVEADVVVTTTKGQSQGDQPQGEESVRHGGISDDLICESFQIRSGRMRKESEGGAEFSFQPPVGEDQFFVQRGETVRDAIIERFESGGRSFDLGGFPEVIGVFGTFESCVEFRRNGLLICDHFVPFWERRDETGEEGGVGHLESY